MRTQNTSLFASGTEKERLNVCERARLQPCESINVVFLLKKPLICCSSQTFFCLVCLHSPISKAQIPIHSNNGNTLIYEWNSDEIFNKSFAVFIPVIFVIMLTRRWVKASALWSAYGSVIYYYCIYFYFIFKSE